MATTRKTVDMASLFSALADRTRLRLLNLMRDQEVCVCYFIEILRAPQPTISRHLAYLRRAGLVASRREATWVHYRIVRPTDPSAARVLDDVMAWLDEDAEMKADRKRLTSVCCAVVLPAPLRGAPRPSKAEQA